MIGQTTSRVADTHSVAPQLSDAGCERERRDLLELGEQIVARVPASRLAFQSWFDATRGLSDEACVTFTPEAALARLAAEFRRLWLKVAHKTADQHMRSPHHADAPITPSGAEVPYGYEREIRPTVLEERCTRYAPAPAGWSAAHVLFSSAQGGLASVLHWAQEDGIWTVDGAPHLTLAGNYFETQDLFGLFCGGELTWSKAKSLEPAGRTGGGPSRVMLIEPVFYDDGVNVFDIDAFRRVWANADNPERETALFVIDTTLTGPAFPLDEFLAALHPGSIVIQIHSGLKLDQAGLELASVGIASIFCADAKSPRAAEIAERLRKIRTATGVGLTLDEISVLEAPWFLDQGYFRRYTQAVFKNNAALATALSGKSSLFAQVLHPEFARADCPWAQAPYCVLRLRDATPENYELLERAIETECERRGLLFDRGGSFGFRSHRYETVTPAVGRGDRFLRIAMGARGGPSLNGIIELMRELSALPSVDKLPQRKQSNAAR